MGNWRVFTTALGLLAFLGCQPTEETAPVPETETAEEETSLNAVDVDPDVNTVELENEWVRVIRVVTPPGHESSRHTHEPGVYVTLKGSKGKATFDGGEVLESESRRGDVGTTFDIVGTPFDIVSIAHVSENVGETESEGVMVELKVHDGTPVDPPSHDAVEVDGEHHTVEFENDRVRVVRMNYPEGHETPVHNHYPGVNIVLSGTKAASGPEGEEAEPAEIEPGTVAWAEGGEPHVTKNLGEEMHIIRVELKKM